MYRCELFSVLRKKDIKSPPEIPEKELSATLNTSGIELQNTAPIDADPEKLDIAVSKLLIENKRDMFIFANALNSTDNSSFRRLFFRMVSHLESDIKATLDNQELSPKLKVASLGDLGNGYKGYCFSICDKRFIMLPVASLTGKEFPQLLRDALHQADEVFHKNAEKHPDGVAFFDKERNETALSLDRAAVLGNFTLPKKEGFFRSFIPSKNDTRSQKARKIVVLIAIVAFVVALSYILYLLFDNWKNDRDIKEIQSIGRDIVYSDDSDDSPELVMHWDELKDINEEIVGWIYIPDTKIDYPVLYHEGDDRYNQYYIKRNYKKEHTEHGSIFIDYRSTDGTASRNVIMHGHDMLDGSMFAGMLKYSPKGDLKGNLDYYREHPVITFNTPDGNAKYKIISVYKTSTRYEHGEFFNYMQGEFNSDAEFMNFVYNSRVRSFFDIPVTCNEDDQIITLSTCCYEFYQWRCVIVARKVRPGEDESVNVDLAKTNPSPLFPDVYYQRYGGTRPEPETFKSAYAKGEIDWYDGKGNLEGSEDLTATLAANPTDPPTEKQKKGKATEPANVVYYQVTYRNDDDTEYAAYNVKQGDKVPIPEGKPTKPDDEYYTYEFDEWNFDVAGVDFDHLNSSVTIYPKFKYTLK